MIVDEGVTSLALAQAIEIEIGQGVRVLCTTECKEGILRNKDMHVMDEEEIEEALAGAKVMIADPLYQPICPKGTRFISLPSESFSGRMYRKEIPNLITEFEAFLKEVL